MKSSRDLVGDDKRALLQEAVNQANPFDNSRAAVADFGVSSVGTPFFIDKVEMAKFLKSTQAKFSIKFPNMTPSRENPDNKE